MHWWGGGHLRNFLGAQAKKCYNVLTLPPPLILGRPMIYKSCMIFVLYLGGGAGRFWGPEAPPPVKKLKGGAPYFNLKKNFAARPFFVGASRNIGKSENFSAEALRCSNIISVRGRIKDKISPSLLSKWPGITKINQKRATRHTIMITILSRYPTQIN